MKRILFFSFLAFTVSIVFGQITKVHTFTAEQHAPGGKYDDYLTNIWKGDWYFQSNKPNTPTDTTKVNSFVRMNIASPQNFSVIMKFRDITYTSNDIIQYRQADNLLYFVIKRVKNYNKPTKEEKYELWRTDGTPANTLKIDEVTSTNASNAGISLGNDGTLQPNPTNIGDKLYYTKLQNWKWDIYETDGNTIKKISGTYQSYSSSTTAHDFLTFKNELYFVANNSKIVKYDGTSLTELATISIQKFGLVKNDRIYFFASNQKPYREGNMPEPTSAFPWNNMGIYETNGTVAGTKESYVVASTSLSYNFTSLVPNLLFKKNDNYFLVPDLQFRENKLHTFGNDIKPKTVDLPDGYRAVSVLSNKEVMYVLLSKSGQNQFDKILRINEDGTTGPVWPLPVTTNGYEIYAGLQSMFGAYKGSLWYSRKESDAQYLNTELWRTNFLEHQFAADLNPDFGWGPNQTKLFYGSNPRNFFMYNDQMYFFADVSKSTALFKFNSDFTFQNTAGNNQWNDANNWKSGIVPYSSDDAIIPDGQQPKVVQNASVKNLTINSPLSLSAGNLSVAGKITVNAKITLNSNNLNLIGTSSQVAEGSPSAYILTNGTGTVNVENLNSARGSVNLPIGTATNYNPVSIANTGTSDTFSARVSDGISNTTNGAVNATWEISEVTAGGSNVSLTLGWNTSQQNAAFNSASAKVGHYLNGNWTAENSGAVSNNSITATGISSFSPFAVMNFGTLAATDFSKSKVSVYPNPFNKNLNISTQESGVVNFYDLSGKLVSTSVLMKGTNSLNKSSLAKGVYIYQIKNANDEILSSGKIIKK